MTAVALSLLANVAILLGVGVWATHSIIFVNEREVPAQVPPAESAATILLEPVQAVEPIVQPADPRFARTTPDQTGAPEKPTPFIGERNTRATSNRPAKADSPPLPSQAGIQPRDATDIETTESDYQDGALDIPENVSTPDPQETASGQPAPEDTRPPVAQQPKPSNTARLLEGPNPVDIPVPRQDQANHDPPQPPAPDPADSPKPPDPDKASGEKETAKPDASPKPTRQPSFRGNQRKTAIVGSITRNGRSSLDVADSPLGRYQAAISRAVELEWQRNCVRHRDFITPGFLTVRFFVQPDGSVRSVEFVGEQLSGAVQKGFTHSSIRDADIPPMPPALKREYQDEPLELQFRFYF